MLRFVGWLMNTYDDDDDDDDPKFCTLSQI